MTMMSKRGFTLLEVMISVAIMGVIMTLIWSSSSQTMTSKERTEARDLVFHSANVALKKISDDLAVAFLTRRSVTTTGPDGSPQTRASPYKTFLIGDNRGGQDAVRFTSLSRLRLRENVKESDQTRISYEAVPNREDSRLFDIVRREQPWLDDSDEVEGRPLPILEGIRSFNLEYYDERKREWVREWHTDKVDWRDRLPIAVKISLVFPDPDGGDLDIPLSTAVHLAMWANPIDQ